MKMFVEFKYVNISGIIEDVLGMDSMFILGERKNLVNQIEDVRNILYVTENSEVKNDN